MPKFLVTVGRRDLFTQELKVTAKSEADAIEQIEQRLEDEGWDEMFGDEGDYQECFYEVDAATIKPGKRMTSEFEIHVHRLFVKPEDQLGRQLHAAVGVAGEAGEVLDAIKKHWIYGAELDIENVLEECGDLLFYVTALLINSGFTIDEAMKHNIAKLKSRYPDGYTDQAAQERLDKVGQ